MPPFDPFEEFGVADEDKEQGSTAIRAQGEDPFAAFDQPAIADDPFADFPVAAPPPTQEESAGFFSNMIDQLVGGYHDWRAASNTYSGIRAEKERQLVESGELPGSRGTQLRELAASMQRSQFGTDAAATQARASDMMRLRQEAADALTRGAEHRARGQEIELSPATQEFLDEDSERSAWEIFWDSPATIVTDLGMRSLPQMAEGLATGAAAGLAGTGPVGFGLGLGSGSARVEMANTVIDAMMERGVDVTNPESVAEFLENEEVMQDIMTRATKRAVVVGGVDALSGIVGGATLSPFKAGLARHGTNLAAQLAVQSGMGAGGEALGQLAEGRDSLNQREIAAEAAGELITGPVEVASAVMSARAKAQDQQAKEPPPGPMSDLENQQQPSNLQAGLRRLRALQEASDQGPLNPERQAELDSLQREYAVDLRGVPTEEMDSLRRQADNDFVTQEQARAAAEVRARGGDALEQEIAMAEAGAEIDTRLATENARLAELRRKVDADAERIAEEEAYAADQAEEDRARAEIQMAAAQRFEQMAARIRNEPAFQEAEQKAARQREFEESEARYQQELQKGEQAEAEAAAAPKLGDIVPTLREDLEARKTQTSSMPEVPASPETEAAPTPTVRALPAPAAIEVSSEGIATTREQREMLGGRVERPGVVNRAEPKKLTLRQRRAQKAAEREQRRATARAAAESSAASVANDLPEPTEGQIRAGNYRKGHVKGADLGAPGIDVTFENAAGDQRRGSTLRDHYGYIKRTNGADGDNVDVFVNPALDTSAYAEDPDSQPVFVVDQVNEQGEFDEHKVMLGYPNKFKASKAYRRNYPSDWTMGTVTQMTLGEFKTWLKESDTTQPVAPVESKQEAPAKKPSLRERREARQAKRGVQYRLPEESFSVEETEDGELYIGATDSSGAEVASMQIEPIPRKNRMEIRLAGVNESYRGQGIGQQLIERAYDIAKEQGMRLVSDRAVSVPQLRVYEALKRKGWTIEYADPATVQTKLEQAAQAGPSAANSAGVSMPFGEGPVVTRIEPPRQQQYRQKTIRNLKGEKILAPREFYRGTNPDNKKRIRTNREDWDSLLFVADSERVAQYYGETIERVAAKAEANILYEGTREFQQLMKGFKLKSASLLDWAREAVARARESGYDAVWFKRQGDLGTAIINENAFERNAPPKQQRLSLPGPKAKGISIESARTTARPFVDEMPLIKPVVLSSPVETPAAVYNQMLADGVRNAKAVYDESTDTIYVFAENHHSEQDLIETLLHEGVAHKGLRYLLGDEFESTMLDIYEKSRNKSDIRRVAETYNYDLSDRAQRIQATDEYIAELAESGDNRSLLNRLYDLVRAALRRLGFVDSWTDNDLRRLLSRSRKNMRQTEGASNANSNVGGQQYRQEDEITTVRMYHGVPAEFVESIRTEGVLESSKKRGRGATFATPKPDIAFAYVEKGGEKALSGKRRLPVVPDAERALVVLDIPMSWYKEHAVQERHGGTAPEVGFDATIPAEFVTEVIVGDRQAVYALPESQLPGVAPEQYGNPQSRLQYRLGDDEKIAPENPQHPRPLSQLHRMASTMEDQANYDPSIVQRMKDKLTDAGIKAQRAVLGAIPRRHVLDFVSKEKLPSGQKYIRTANRMDGRRNELMAKGEPIGKAWNRFISKNKEQGRILGELMQAATLAGVDPSNDFKPSSDPVVNAKRQGDYRLLKKWWNKLDPEAQQIYRDVRDYYMEQRQTVFDALQARIEATEASGETRKKLIALLRKQFESGRVEGPYFPLSRFGDYWAAARDTAGEVVSFSRFESPSMQREWVKKMESSGFSVDQGSRMLDKDVTETVSPTFAAKVTELVKKAGDTSLADEIWQMYLATLPEISMRKAFMHRKGRLGFSMDSMRAFGHAVFHGAHQTARLEHMYQLEDQLNRIRDEAAKLASKKDPEQHWAAAVYAEMKDRHEWAKNPQASAWASALTGLGFAWYLGTTPAAAFVNLTQTALVGLPVLGAQFGMAKSGAALAKAGTLWAGSRGPLKNRLRGDERKAFEEAQRIGLFEKTQAYDLAGLAEHGSEYSSKWQAAMNAMAFLFHKAEEANRQVTFLAAYRLAREKGMTHEAAVLRSEELVWDSHYDYNNTNRPRYVRSDLAKVIFLFRNYSLNTTYRLVRDFNDMTRGLDKETRRQARVRFGGIMMMTGLFSGLTGLPVVWSIARMLESMFDEPDDPYDAQEALYAHLAEAYGSRAAMAIMRGPIDALTDATVSTRVSLAHLWLREPDAGLEGREQFAHYLGELAGPIPGIAEDMFQAGVAYQKTGDPYRSLEYFMPKFLEDQMKALRYIREGAQNYRGDPYMTAEDFSGWDAFLQATGFVPADLQQRYDEMRGIRNTEARILGRKQALMDRLFAAARNQDRKGVQQALEDIGQFNTTNPGAAISADTVMRSASSRAAAAASTLRGVRLTTDNLRYLHSDMQLTEK